jgi:uncharacterized membrane protein
MIRIIQILLGLLLIFFLPGFFAVNALFPRKNELDDEYDMLYRITLGIGLSIVITILDGFALGNPSVRAFKSTPIWISLGIISVLLFFIGWIRGAYCSLAKIGFARNPPSFTVKTRNPRITELAWLNYDKEKKKEMIKKYEKKIANQKGKIRQLMNRYYLSKKEQLERELKETDEND